MKAASNLLYALRDTRIPAQSITRVQAVFTERVLTEIVWGVFHDIAPQGSSTCLLASFGHLPVSGYINLWVINSSKHAIQLKGGVAIALFEENCIDDFGVIWPTLPIGTTTGSSSRQDSPKTTTDDNERIAAKAHSVNSKLDPRGTPRSMDVDSIADESRIDSNLTTSCTKTFRADNARQSQGDIGDTAFRPAREKPAIRISGSLRDTGPASHSTAATRNRAWMFVALSTAPSMQFYCDTQHACEANEWLNDGHVNDFNRRLQMGKVSSVSSIRREPRIDCSGSRRTARLLQVQDKSANDSTVSIGHSVAVSTEQLSGQMENACQRETGGSCSANMMKLPMRPVADRNFFLPEDRRPQTQCISKPEGTFSQKQKNKSSPTQDLLSDATKELIATEMRLISNSNSNALIIKDYFLNNVLDDSLLPPYLKGLRLSPEDSHATEDEINSFIHHCFVTKPGREKLFTSDNTPGLVADFEVKVDIADKTA